MRTIRWSIVAAIAVIVSVGCASVPSQTPSSQAPSSSYGLGELDELSRIATIMLREYMAEYGLAEQAQSVVLEVSPPVSMLPGEGGSPVALLTSVVPHIDGKARDELKVTTIASGSSREQAERQLAWNASGIVGDPLIGFLSARGYDYETESLGGYGFYLTSVAAYDDDEAVLQEFTSDLIDTARTILALAEPVLLARLPAEAPESEPGEPVGILQFTLMGASSSPSGHTTVSALFDETRELSDALNSGIEWPSVQGIYSISIGYGRRPKFGSGGSSELFPEPTGQEEQLIADAPPTSLASLDLFGPTVPDEVSGAYRAAGGYNDDQRWEPAAQLGAYAMHLAGKAGTTLSLLQVERLVTVRAYAVADAGNRELAAELYDYRLDVLIDTNGWETRLPPGLQVVREYDERLWYALRSHAHRDRALFNTVPGGRMPEVLADLERAVEFTIPAGRREDAVEIQRMVLGNVIQTRQFGEALDAVEARMTEIEETGVGVIAEVLFAILRMGGVSAVNIDDLPLAQTYYQRIVELADAAGYSDGLLEDDRRGLDMINAELERRQK